jgi:hypothetical protein
MDLHHEGTKEGGKASGSGLQALGWYSSRNIMSNHKGKILISKDTDFAGFHFVKFVPFVVKIRVSGSTLGQG